MTPAHFMQLMTRESAAAIDAAWARLDRDSRAAIARERNASGETALHVAARRGLVSLVDPLLRAGSDIDARCPARLTPFHVALRAGHETPAVMLLDRGADIDAYGARGLTVLHQSVMAADIQAVKWLLRHGANPRLLAYDPACSDMTAFHLAATTKPAVLQALLREASAPALQDVYYINGVAYDLMRTVLAAQRIDMLDVLIDYGVNINAAGVDGHTPAMFLLHHRTSMVDSADVLRRLHEAGADMLQATSAGGETLLMVAAAVGWVQAFDYLLGAGISPQARKSDGTTLLHIAARGMRTDLCLRVLALTPDDVNVQNNLGQTPLWLAAHHNRRDNVIALLDAGADPTIADYKLRTPDMVCQGPMQTMTRKLVMDAQRKWPDSAKPQRGKRSVRGSEIRNRRGRRGFYPSKPR